MAVDDVEWDDDSVEWDQPAEPHRWGSEQDWQRLIDEAGDIYQENAAASVPAAAGVVAGTALPAGIAAGTAGGIVIGAGQRALGGLIRGDSPGDIVRETTIGKTHIPFTDYDVPSVGLDAILGGVGGAIGKIFQPRAQASSAIDDVLEAPNKTPVEYPADVLDDADRSAPSTIEPPTFKDRLKAASDEFVDLQGQRPPEPSGLGAQRRSMMRRWTGSPIAQHETLDPQARGLTDPEVRSMIQTAGEVPEALEATYAPRIRDIFADLSPEEKAQVSLLKMGQLEPHLATPKAVAAERAIETGYYAPIAEEEIGAGVMTGLRPFERNVPEGYTAYSPFRMQEEAASSRFPWQGVRRKQAVAHARTAGSGLPPDLELDAEKLAIGHLAEHAPLIGRSKAYGGGAIAQVAPESPVGAFGPKGVEKLNELMRLGRYEEADVLESAMRSAYSSHERVPFLDTARSRIHSSILGTSVVSNLPQYASPVWRYGPKNVALGLKDWFREPGFKQSVRDSGAGVVSTAALIDDSAKTSPGFRAMSAFERSARGPMNAGYRRYVSGLADQVAAGKDNGAIRKQLQELGITRTDLSNGASDDLMQTLAKRTADRTQLKVATGAESGPLWQSPMGKLAVGLSTFPAKQWSLFRRDIASPIYQGAKSLDPSLFGLGAKRLGLGIAATAPLAAGVEGVNSSLSGRDFDQRNFWLNELTAMTGMPGLLASAAFYNRSPHEDFVPPTVAMPAQAATDVYQGATGGSSEKLLRGLYDLGMVLSPSEGIRGAMALGRKPVRGALRESR